MQACARNCPSALLRAVRPTGRRALREREARMCFAKQRLTHMISRWLIILGIVLVVVGVLWPWLSKLRLVERI